MKVAVVLSGCGVFDGSEIHESVLCLLALAQAGHTYRCFAPDIQQKKVVNHLTKHEETEQVRNVLEESARIARGDIRALSQLVVDDFDAILIPGGLGAAKNLSTFASEKENCSVLPELSSSVLGFHKAKKPIGATCIAPAVLAKIFQDHAVVTMTLGKNSSSNGDLVRMGMKAAEASVTECIADEDNKVFSTPCYMEPSDLAGMFQGISKLVEKMTQ